jgi:small multidrug resistance pump
VSAAALGWLTAAILAQVVGIGALRAADGFRRPVYTVLTLVAIGASAALMSRALESGLSLAVGYGIWTGSGIALATLGGAAVFGDRLGRREWLGVGLILLGVVVVHAGG